MLTTLPDYTTLPGHRLGLKVVYADGRPESDKAPPDFRWPLTVGATVTAPDWRPDAECGGGLHVWPDGGGDLGVSNLHDRSDDTVTWLAVDYAEADAVDLNGKAKVRECTVVAVGVRTDVASWIAARVRTPVHYATVTAGDNGTATAGNRGTATAGNRGTATAGYNGTATAGNDGTATAGYNGTATAGDEGTASAGLGGCISVLWYDHSQDRYRRATAEVDGVTIKAGVKYRVVDGRLVEVS
jgi:hypothetical protein